MEITEAMVMNVLQRKAFRNWLRSKPDGATVGFARFTTRCPIANFLCEAAWIGAVVGPCLVHIPKGDLFVETPLWATLFIHAVDAMGDGERISKEEALELLRKVRVRKR